MNPNPNPDSAVVEYEMGYGADEFGKVLRGPFSGERTDFECHRDWPNPSLAGDAVQNATSSA